MKRLSSIPENSKMIYDSRICRVDKIDKNFVSFNFKSNHDSEIVEFEELINVLIKEVDYKPFVAINDLRGNLGSFTNEVKEYLVNHPNLKKYKYAEAVVVDNLGTRIQLNFFIKMNKKKGILLKAFSDYKSAYQWILQKKQELF